MAQPVNPEILEKYSEWLFDELSPELQSAFKLALDQLYEDSSLLAINESNNLNEHASFVNRQLSEMLQSLNCQLECTQGQAYSDFSDPSILAPAIEALKKLHESTNMLKAKAKVAFPKEKIDENSKVSILRFYCKKDDEDNLNWVLCVENATQDYFRKVEFFISESNEKIAEIRLLEPEINIKRHLGKLNPSFDYYGNHIIAKVDGRPVSELFPIMKVEFKGAELGDNDNLCCTIANSSNENLDNLYVFCNETSQSYPVGKTLQPGETHELEISIENLSSISIRVMKDHDVVSIAYSLLNLDEDEEDEGSEEEKNEENSKGLSMSCPFPGFRAPVIDPAIQKVNEALVTLGEAKIQLAEMIKREYPEVAAKMQLYKAVSRYNTYDDCIGYLMDAGVIN
ncbi:unnamed protein product [Blepharisma stoltei]|uniref:Uncharacterized protein n=1 Tax=Blepharisma stoltei TaxID=1481888 RepID=A0AAU9IPB4_9CILI|nr:unnamed protein product [Blepharisma stoltei]